MAFSDDQIDGKTDLRCSMFNACLLAIMTRGQFQCRLQDLSSKLCISPHLTMVADPIHAPTEHNPCANRMLSPYVRAMTKWCLTNCVDSKPTPPDFFKNTLFTLFPSDVFSWAFTLVHLPPRRHNHFLDSLERTVFGGGTASIFMSMKNSPL